MTHAEAIANLQAYGEGKLPPEGKKETTRHLQACAACRELAERWPRVLPAEGFTDRVLARLPEERVRAASWQPLLAPLAGAAFAALLVAAAFWHPERGWVRADKYFARFDQAAHAVPFNPENLKENRYE